MISVDKTYNSLLSFLFDKIDRTVLADLVYFLYFHSDDDIVKFDKLSEISDSLESFCEENDLPEGYWMNYGSELDIIKDLFHITLIRLCEQLLKS